MKLVLDPDVEKVLDFMAREIKGERLLFVARSVARVAELSWTDAVPRAPSSNAIELSEWAGLAIERTHD